MPHIFPLRPWLLGMFVLLAPFGALQSVAQNAAESPHANELQNAAAQKDAKAGRPSVPLQPGPKTDDANGVTMGSSPLLLGPGDELEITVYGAPDLSGHTRISDTGNVSVPLIGYVRLAGLSTSEAEAAIEAQLRQNKIVNDPQVSIYAKDFTTSGISVAGEVAKPGFYSAVGPHRLFDVLQLAGGTTDKASNKVTISHREQARRDDGVDLEKSC